MKLVCRDKSGVIFWLSSTAVLETGKTLKDESVLCCLALEGEAVAGKGPESWPVCEEEEFNVKESLQRQSFKHAP